MIPPRETPPRPYSRGPCAASPLGALLAAVAVVLIFATVACGSDSEPGNTASATPTAAVTATGAPGTAPPTPSPAGPAVTFTTQSGRTASLYVEIADTPEEHSVGLMNRERLPDDAGMLFVWPEDTGAAFWMKDTLIPLSIAFIDANGVILDIQDMQPLDETLHQSPAPYRYAVEANQGWFVEHGIAPGDTVTLPDGSP